MSSPAPASLQTPGFLAAYLCISIPGLSDLEIWAWPGCMLWACGLGPHSSEVGTRVRVAAMFLGVGVKERPCGK